MQYAITLIAGIPQRQEFTGSTLVLLDTGSASSVDMQLEVYGFHVEDFKGVKRGLNIQADNGQRFTGATFTSSVSTTIQVITSTANISVNYMDGANVNATIVGLPLQVSNDRGTVGTPLYVSGITYSDAPAATLVDNAPVAVTSAGQALLAANTVRKSARFTNLGPDPVTIGFTGQTWGKRCLVLSAGDMWLEDRAANLAWVAITDVAKTASVTVQEVRT